MSNEGIDLRDDVSNEIRMAVLGAHHTVMGYVNKLEERLEVQEQQLAFLTKAYAELAVLVQTLMTVSLTDENKERFNEQFRAGVDMMMEAFRNGIHQGKTESPRFHAQSDITGTDS